MPQSYENFPRFPNKVAEMFRKRGFYILIRYIAIGMSQRHAFGIFNDENGQYLKKKIDILIREISLAICSDGLPTFFLSEGIRNLPHDSDI